MRRLVTFLLLLAVVIFIVGLNRGWFTVNREKINEDKQTIEQKATELEGKIKGEVNKDVEKAKDANGK